MGIDGIPKVKGGGPTADATAKPSAEAGARKQAGPPPEAMEKPPVMSQPDAASTHPVRQAPPGKPQLHEKELADLRRALRASGGDKLAAGKQALALAAGYRMRRSRGARRQALDLCAEVAEEIEELAELARALATVLDAEGDLHDTSAEATLRACRALVDVIGDEP